MNTTTQTPTLAQEWKAPAPAEVYPQRRPVATYTVYRAAQRAVGYLADQHFPVQQCGHCRRTPAVR